MVLPPKLPGADVPVPKAGAFNQPPPPARSAGAPTTRRSEDRPSRKKSLSRPGVAATHWGPLRSLAETGEQKQRVQLRIDGWNQGS